MRAELIDFMGSDARVVDAARVSFSKEASNFTDEQNDKLISYLAKHGHWSPFSHPQITIRETVPIFVARQRFKHVVGFAYNEVSRRYVDDPPEFYTPDEWRGKPVNAKQGSSDEVIKWINHGDEYYDDGFGEKLIKVETNIHEEYGHLIDYCTSLYDKMIQAGVAPEQARMILPQSMYTSYYVTGSLAAWARAYKQRIDSHAQKEIQDLAKQWNEIIEPLFPVSWKALTE